MNSALFLFLFFFVILAIIALFRFCRLRITRFSIPSFVFWMIFIFSYIGIYIFFFELSFDRGDDPLITQESTLTIFAYTSVTLLALCLGMILMSVFPGVAIPRGMDRCEPFRVSSKQVFCLTALAALCMFVLVVYVQQIGVTALQVALNGESSEIGMARSGMGNDFAGSYHWYRIFMRDLLLVSTLGMFSQLLSKVTIPRLFIYISTFFAMSFSAVMAAEKMPMVEVIIGHYIVYIYMKKHGSYVSIATFLFFSLSISIISVFYITFMGVQNVEDSLFLAFSRAATGSLQPFYWLIGFFDDKPFLFGRSFPNPGGLLPFENFRLTVELMDWARPDVSQRGIVGSAPTIFIGEAYANFGPIGVFTLPFFIGCWLYIVYSMISRLVDSPLKIGYLAWAAIHFGGLAISGIGTYLFDFTLLVVTLFVLGTMWVSGNRILKGRSTTSVAGSPVGDLRLVAL